ncbi:hypothetical protein [Streptomyces sp. NBC_00057]|uniref:hypothetical protein n=1 Tax=Streptomyces sp. NBC_00057 TaxID=2975634 RepID=UPI0038657E32
MPDRYGSWTTLRTRFRRWAKDGTFDGEWPTGFGLARRHATNMLLAGVGIGLLMALYGTVWTCGAAAHPERRRELTCPPHVLRNSVHR